MSNNRTSLKNITKQLVDFSNEVVFQAPNEESVKRVIDILRYDYVVTFHLGTVQYSFDQATNVAKIRPQYLYSKGEYETLISKVLLKLTEIKEQIVVLTTDLEKELFIHDYLCKSIEYNDDGRNSHSIIGPLLYGRGVCEGISKTAQALFKISNIESHVICGVHFDEEQQTKTPHSWNAVKINNKWFMADITFDNTLSGDEIRYDYFNVSSSDILETHKPDDYNKYYYFLCTDNENYFKIRGIEFYSEKELLTFINKNVKLRNKIIYFRLVNDAQYLLGNNIKNQILTYSQVESLFYSVNKSLNVYRFEIKYRNRLFGLF